MQRPNGPGAVLPSGWRGVLEQSRLTVEHRLHKALSKERLSTRHVLDGERRSRAGRQVLFGRRVHHPAERRRRVLVVTPWLAGDRIPGVTWGLQYDPDHHILYSL